MAFYNEGSQWNQQGRQPSWEQPAPPSRSGASSAVQREELAAFQQQFEDIEKAMDNLAKSGKFFNNMPPMGSPGPSRRDSMPSSAGGRGFPGEFGGEMRGGGGSQRHHSVHEYDGLRSPSASSVQGFYANQRYGGSSRGGNEADQMMQQKRRLAAQRERELRNYHQEQQYNRNVSGGKSDRSMSPNAMSEEDRRELLTRQHRALYGEASHLYNSDGTQRPQSQDARLQAGPTGGRGPSPLAYDPFGSQGQGNAPEGAVQMPSRDQASNKDAAAGAQRSRANSNSPSATNPASFSLYDNAQQSSRTSNSSPTGGSPPNQGGKGPNSNVAPIGTRPSQTSGGPLKGRTTPLPSPLSFGYSASEQNNNQNERSSSATPNTSTTAADRNASVPWGSNSGVWGNSSKSGALGVQASVWG